TAQQVLEELKGEFPSPIVTELSPLDIFYPAEEYHQNYYNQNSRAGYCRVVITPKVQKLRKQYADRLIENA
ncbi:MAG: peptide-methionine (S)-S-oxide reductase, partial [Bacteroidota bacterium]